MNYSSYNELLGNYLEPCDTVTFHFNGSSITYLVRMDYLENISHTGYDAEIFQVLKLSIVKTCDDSYGYPAGPYHDFPEFYKEDYEAATRLVLNLFKEIETQSRPVVTLKVGDNVTFRINGVTYTGYVHGSKDYFLGFIRNAHNKVIFDILGVAPNELQEKCLGYSDNVGHFPYCKSLEDLTKFCNYIQKYIERKNYDEISKKDTPTIEEVHCKEIGPEDSLLSELALIVDLQEDSNIEDVQLILDSNIHIERFNHN